MRVLKRQKPQQSLPRFRMLGPKLLLLSSLAVGGAMVVPDDAHARKPDAARVTRLSKKKLAERKERLKTAIRRDARKSKEEIRKKGYVYSSRMWVEALEKIYLKYIEKTGKFPTTTTHPVAELKEYLRTGKGDPKELAEKFEITPRELTSMREKIRINQKAEAEMREENERARIYKWGFVAFLALLVFGIYKWATHRSKTDEYFTHSSGP